MGKYAQNEIIKVKSVKELCDLFCKFCETGFEMNNTYNIGRMNFISMKKKKSKSQIKV